MCSSPARPLVQPAKNSCFSIGNTALQPARPAGPPFSVIQAMHEELRDIQMNELLSYLCTLYIGERSDISLTVKA